MVIATQNPVEQAGTYKLPEAQLDRFLIKTEVGYPDRSAAVQILAGSATPDRTKNLPAAISTQAVADMATLAADNHVEESVLDYIQRLVEATRDSADTTLGVSTRGAIAMVRVARVWALAQARNYVLPDDVKALIGPVWTHRLVLTADAEFAGTTPASVIQHALDTVEAPLTRQPAGR